MHKVGDLLAKVMPTKVAGPTDGSSYPSKVESLRVEYRPAAPLAVPEGDEAIDSDNTAPVVAKTLSRSYRYRPKSELTLVKSILSKVLAKKGLDEKVERYGFVLYWKEIVGEHLAEVSRPEYISRRALIVRVAHSTWAQELAFMKPAILAKLSLYLKPGDFVDDVVLRVGPL